MKKDMKKDCIKPEPLREEQALCSIFECSIFEDAVITYNIIIKIVYYTFLYIVLIANQRQL